MNKEHLLQDTKKIIELSDDELSLILIECTDVELQQLLEDVESYESEKNVSQMMQKILMNSLYGALSNIYFVLFNEKIAQAITGNGRYFIQELANYVDRYLKSQKPRDESYIIYGDTDSIYYTIAPIMEDYINQNPNLDLNDYIDYANEYELTNIQPVVQNLIEDYTKKFNSANKSVISAEREIIADKAVFTEKKKYYARVRDDEGKRFPLDSPKIKVMGLDISKSGTPLWSKKKLKESINVILDTDELELKNWIKSIKQEFIHAPISDISNIIGASSLDYTLGEKGIPYQSRSAIVHNNFVKDNDLEDVINLLDAGDKYKHLHLLEPNIFNSDRIAFLSSKIEDIILENNCVDYDTQYEKQFLNLLNLMVKSLGYDIYQKAEQLDEW